MADNSCQSRSGFYAEIVEMTFGNYRIIWTDGRVIDDGWWYDSEVGAREALREWESRGFQGEPQGWYRNPNKGLRRTGGDPDLEYYAP